MPILCEPDATFPVVLESDKNKTPQPTFIAKAQSMRGQQRIGATLDLWNEPELPVDELFEKTLEVLGAVFVGWRNMPTAYSVDALAETINYAEARELLRLVLFASQLDPESKKS